MHVACWHAKYVSITSQLHACGLFACQQATCKVFTLLYSGTYHCLQRGHLQICLVAAVQPLTSDMPLAMSRAHASAGW